MGGGREVQDASTCAGIGGLRGRPGEAQAP